MAGRPTRMTQSVLDKLEYAFRIGSNQREACLFAGINESTIIDYKHKHPEYSEQIEKFQEEPILKARKTIYDNLEDPKTAQWYLERKKKKEFSTRVETVDPDDVKEKDEKIDTMKDIIEALRSDVKSAHNQPN